MADARGHTRGVAKCCDAAAGTDDNAVAPWQVTQKTCPIQAVENFVRLLVVFGRGLDDDIDACLCISKAIEYLLDSDHSLIVKCIINSEHHAIDCTGIIRLQVNRVGEYGVGKPGIGRDGILQVPEQKLKIGAIGNADIRNGLQCFGLIAAVCRLPAISFSSPFPFRLHRLAAPSRAILVQPLRKERHASAYEYLACHAQALRIRRINALAGSASGCIALALGEPDFPTPDVISAEVTTALGRGDTHYPPNNGRPALREALSAYMGDVALRFRPTRSF